MEKGTSYKTRVNVDFDTKHHDLPTAGCRYNFFIVAKIKKL